MATSQTPESLKLHRKLPYPRVILLAAGTVTVLSALTYGVIRSTEPPSPVKYLTAMVRRGSLSETDSATGEVVPAETDTVAVPSNAVVSTVPVHLGEVVTQGTTLATFSDPTLVSTVAAEQAVVSAQSAQVNLLTSSSYTASQQDNITQAQDNLIQAEEILSADKSAGNVVSPAGGIVSQLTSVGTAVTAGQSIAMVDGKPVQAPMTGTVQTISVVNGQTVNPGTLLLAITSPALQAKIVGDEGQIAGLQAALDKAEAQDSPAQNATAAAEARAQLQRDDETLAQEQQALAGLVVKAPFAGEITALNLSSPAKLLTLSSLAQQVTVPIPETQVAMIHLGQSVQLSLPALPGQTLAGSVQNIAPVGTYSNGVSSFPVNVNLTHSSEVRYGMSAQANIVIRTVHNALLVPLSAIQTHGLHHFVQWLGANNTVTRTPVRVLLENATTAAIKSKHLTTNMRVITATLTASNGKLHLKTKGRALHRAHPKGPRGGKKA
ncbi:MAG: hypothetical protein C7B44_08605 [Sulfobacillus thermosulfidooxidans]|nr:MAG: hypothetical protein C7B44_08605 [Sulfobacillus thermosulfidooxidans]